MRVTIAQPVQNTAWPQVMHSPLTGSTEPRPSRTPVGSRDRADFHTPLSLG